VDSDSAFLDQELGIAEEAAARKLVSIKLGERDCGD